MQATPLHALASLALLLSAPLGSIAAAQDDMGWTGVLDEASFAALHELTGDKAPALLGEEIQVAGMGCYLSKPTSGEPLGAVIVIHEWWGLNDHVKHWADRLAGDGYVALAVDLYGGVVATTREQAMQSMRGVEQGAATSKLVAAHDWLTDGEGPIKAQRTASIGWCFGGAYSLNLAIAEPELDAAVVYYGRLITDVEKLKGIKAPMLGVFGNQDRGIPPESVDAFAEAMMNAGNDLSLRRYDAPHAFANPSSARYDAKSAGLAWRETRAFLCEHMWPDLPDGKLMGGALTLASDVPEGWTSGDTSAMRLASYKLSEKTECVVFGFPGDVGGLLPNLNRWQVDQMGGAKLTQEDAQALPRIPMLGVMAPVMRTDGSYKNPAGEVVDSGALLVNYAHFGPETVVVKMLGDRDEVDAATADFIAFSRSLRIVDPAASAATGDKGAWIPLFNGRDLDGWTPKFKGHPAGENVLDTFAVEDGLLRVKYDAYEDYGQRFAHLFFNEPFSHYDLRVVYRFAGEQCPGGPGWARRNNGVMLHGQSLESMGLDQSFPVSVEAQMLGERDGGGERSNGNVCTPGTHVHMNGELVRDHCISSKGKTSYGDGWVEMRLEVRGHGPIRQYIDGELVLEYERPILDENDNDAQKLLAAGAPVELGSGTISIQGESHPTDFKSIEIRVLAEDISRREDR